MNAIEKRARELLDAELRKLGLHEDAYRVGCGADLDRNDQASINAIATALTPPEGYVLVPIDSVRQCGCGCHRYCCGSCGTELGGHSYEPTRPEVP